MNRIIFIADSWLWVDAISTVLSDDSEFIAIDSNCNINDRANHISGSETVVIEYDPIRHSCLEIIHDLAGRFPGITMIIVGIPDNPRLIVSYLEEGCSSYVRSSDPLQRLKEILHQQATDGTIIDPHVANTLLKRLNELHRQVQATPARPAFGKTTDADLTQREHEVLQLVGDGLTNQEIADRLHIEIGTAKNHVHNLLRKLDARDRREAAQYLHTSRVSRGLRGSNRGYDQVQRETTRPPGAEIRQSIPAVESPR